MSLPLCDVSCEDRSAFFFELLLMVFVTRLLPSWALAKHGLGSHQLNFHAVDLVVHIQTHNL